MGTLRLQGGDIPILRCVGLCQAGWQFSADDGVAVTAQQLEQEQQAFGTGHGMTPHDLWLACIARRVGTAGIIQELWPRKSVATRWGNGKAGAEAGCAGKWHS